MKDDEKELCLKIKEESEKCFGYLPKSFVVLIQKNVNGNDLFPISLSASRFEFAWRIIFEKIKEVFPNAKENEECFVDEEQSSSWEIIDNSFSWNEGKPVARMLYQDKEDSIVVSFLIQVNYIDACIYGAKQQERIKPPSFIRGQLVS